MMRYPKTRTLILFLLPSLFLSSTRGQGEDRPIWEQEALLIYSESSGNINRLRLVGSENRRLALYTQALDILYGNREVKEGEEPYREARRMFRILVADVDDDAIGLASAYYLARIAQSNPFEKDISEAKKLYWDLYDRWPDRFFGQMAFAKYVTLEIYDDDGSGVGALERIAKIEPMVKTLSLPNIRQGVHRVLGEAYVRFELEPEGAYAHFTEAYQLGIQVDSIRVQVLERIASIGAEIGQIERALRAYEEILLLAPRHERRKEFEAEAMRLRKALVKSAG